MPYLIKRYANRKLYDTQTKRYLTHDEVAVLVRAGEEVSVVDAETGEDLTGQVLSKIIAEGNRRQTGLVPSQLLVELIQRPGEMVVDAVRSSVSVGQRRVEQLGGELYRLLTGGAGLGDKADAAADEEAAERLARFIEDRVRKAIAELDLAPAKAVEDLAKRVAALEEGKPAAARAARGAPAKPRARRAKKPGKPADAD
jgi:polyhydroxyalkanoate synthesis repressor PhaR